jgi:hypothetical protein
MMVFFYNLYTFFLFTAAVFTGKAVTYRVEGETINQILKYKVTPYDIYQLNPDKAVLVQTVFY